VFSCLFIPRSYPTLPPFQVVKNRLEIISPYYRENGYDVLDRLKNDARFSNIPVVAYTTHVSHMNQARDAGFHSFLGKPLNDYLFPEQLNRILQGESVWEVS
jgi:two-component system cell cycle response regulator DivK